MSTGLDIAITALGATLRAWLVFSPNTLYQVKRLFSIASPVDGQDAWREGLHLMRIYGNPAHSSATGVCYTSPLLLRVLATIEEWGGEFGLQLFFLLLPLVTYRVLLLTVNRRLDLGAHASATKTAVFLITIAYWLNPLMVLQSGAMVLSAVDDCLLAGVAFWMQRLFLARNRGDGSSQGGWAVIWSFVAVGLLMAIHPPRAVILVALMIASMPSPIADPPASPSTPGKTKSERRHNLANAFHHRALIIVLGSIGVAAMVVLGVTTTVAKVKTHEVIDPWTHYYRATLLLREGIPLSPSLGVQWYMFQLMFLEYSTLYAVALRLFPLILVVPLGMKLHHIEGDNGTTVAPGGFGVFVLGGMLVALCRPYLEISELVMAFVVMPTTLTFGVVQHHKNNFAFFAIAFVTIPLVHAFYYAWLKVQVANPNFLFFTCVALNGGLAVFIAEYVKQFVRQGRLAQQA